MTQDPAFHLYLLIGQSNMAGRGQVEPQDREPHSRLFALDQTAAWVPAVDPLHFDKPFAGVGPGLTFGRILAGRDPSLCLGLIPCAVGGTSINAWRPGAYWPQTGTKPYDDALARTRVAMARGLLKGILWHQGESDCQNQVDADKYGENLQALINELREDLGVGMIPFVAGTLADSVVTRYPAARVVNRALRELPGRIANTACVNSAGLVCSADGLHFTAAAARELGRRYAEAVIGLGVP
jgi:hypothetical protein